MKKFIILLFLFHAIISVFTYDYAINNTSDSTLYWLLNYDVNQYNWLDFFRVGSPFMVFLNYPLLKLGLPFWAGHIVYSLIGFLGIYLFAKWALEVLKIKSGNLLAFVILAFIFCSPNLHVWTSIIGKESIVFWSLSALFYSSLSIKKRWILSAIATFLLVMVRPHVAFMLLSAAIIVFLIDRSLSLKIRGLVFGGAVIIGAGLFYLMLKISNIRYLDWDRIQHFNAFSILSLKDSSGYVPMLDYSYIYKLFSLNFRPLFYDAYHTMTVLASFENLISLLFVVLGLFLAIKRFRTLVFTRWMKVSFLFFIIASVLYVERYSNLGLFMRTKMMYMPFLFVTVTSIISQSITNSKPKYKLLRITTVPMSLHFLLKGQLQFINQHLVTLGVSSGPTEELEAVARREGVEVREVNMSRAITPLKDLKSVWRMYKLFTKEKPSIVHTHTPKAGIVGMLASNLAGIPIRLHTVAGMPLMEANGIKRKILDSVEKLTYRCATKVYPNSKGLEQFIQQHMYIKAKKVKVIANGSTNGIDTQFFCPGQISEEKGDELRSELNIQETDFVFIFVGRLVGDKGINELVQAFQNSEFNTEASAQNSKLILVGPFESDLDPLLSETLKEIKNNSNIITTGFQEDVRQFLAISDALAFPSYREGFPNVVMQAGAMGLPSIVTDINGCNEIIKEGKNGLIISAKNTELLKEAMLRLVEDSELYDTLKKNAREMITSRYKQKIVWEALLQEYKTLLNEKGIKY